MKHRTIFAALMLCLGTLNGCGAARPSKFYQLTLPNDKTPGADPAPSGHTAPRADHHVAPVSRRSYCLHL